MRRSFGVLALTLALAGCGHHAKRTTHPMQRAAHPATQPASVAHHAHQWESVNDAIAVLHPTQGQSVRGTVRFTQEGDDVAVVAHVEGLPPNSTHGFHVHEFGDCSAPDAGSAGGHYNPEKHDHGKPDAPEAGRHAGDMGNLTANAQGVADLTLTLRGVSVAGLRNPILGRAVIVHEKADDWSQPTGNAGGRLACGVIGVGKK